jgi:pimeloyl-ACP methyl ester carboxylesterase
LGDTLLTSERIRRGWAIIAPAYADEFAGHIASARVAMLDGVGHMPHFEQAGNVAKLVGEFLGA